MKYFKEVIRENISTYFKWICGIMILLLISLAFNFLYPLTLSYFINSVENQTVVSIRYFFWLIFAILVFKVLSNYFSEIYNLLFDRLFKVQEYTKLYDQLFHVKFEKIQREEPVSFLGRIDLYIQQIYKAISDTIPNAIISVVTLVICLAIAFSINPYLALALICVFPIQVISYKKINKRLAELSVKLQEVSSKSYAYFVHIIQSFELIKQVNNSSFFSGLIEKEFIKLRTITFKINSYASTATNLSDFVIDLINTFALFYAIYLYYLHSIPMASVFLFYEIKSIYENEIKKVVRININLRDLGPAVSYIKEQVLDNIEEENGEKLEAIEDVSIGIESFGFEDKEVLHQIFFNIKKGNIIGLKGESGRGKTTLVRLLTRLYDTDQIKINQKPVSEYELSSFRKKVYMVSQNAMFFNGTIKDNILCGYENYDNEWLETIINSKFFSSIKEISPDLMKDLTDGGQNISGGQKQVIAIARMLIRKPELIILDESFANIDEERERAFFEDFDAFLKERIVLVISHRKSTMQKCTQILEL